MKVLFGLGPDPVSGWSTSVSDGAESVAQYMAVTAPWGLAILCSSLVFASVMYACTDSRFWVSHELSFLSGLFLAAVLLCIFGNIFVELCENHVKFVLDRLTTVS